jgi:hypothetical protein
VPENGGGTMSAAIALSQEPQNSTAISNWKSRGVELAQAHKKQQWQIAEWILEGLNQPGADASFVYDTAESLFPYSRSSLMQFAYVARIFPESMRIDSDWLTFSHYQAVLAAGSQIPKPDTPDKQRERLQWLAQAHAQHLTVSALRLGIANAFELATAQGGNDTTQPKEQLPTKSKAPKSKPTPLGARLGGAAKRLEELAHIRGVKPDMLLAHIVDDYLAAHADEVADAADRLAKRKAEADAVIDAARAIREAEIAHCSAARKAESEYRQAREPLVQQLRVLSERLSEGDEVREWLSDNPKLPISELEAAVAVYQSAVDESVPVVESDGLPTCEELASFKNRAGKILYDKLAKDGGMKQADASAAIKNYILEQGGAPAMEKILKTKWEEILTMLESATAVEAAAIVKGAAAIQQLETLSPHLPPEETVVETEPVTLQ